MSPGQLAYDQYQPEEKDNQEYSSPAKDQSEPEKKDKEGYSSSAYDKSEPEEKDEQVYLSPVDISQTLCNSYSSSEEDTVFAPSPQGPA